MSFKALRTISWGLHRGDIINNRDDGSWRWNLKIGRFWFQLEWIPAGDSPYGSAKLSRLSVWIKTDAP